MNPNLSDSSHVANRTCAKRTQQSDNDLTKGLDYMHITANTALSMQEIAEWRLVGGEDADYNNPIRFQEAWDHEEENERKKWRKAIHKEITNMTNVKCGKGLKRIKFQLIKD